MKTMKRLTAALLAVLLLAGLFPVLATAQEQEPEQKTVRTSVMIGADGLIESDTLVLGYAKPDAAVTGYPLEWQVLSADKDSQGREGGKLLVSKYLLPAVKTAGNGGLDMSTLSGIHMPESYAVLPTTLSDAAYVANLNANIISDYKDGKVSYAGLYTQRADDALTAANFFALSAEEAEHYFANSDEKRTENNKNDLLRRPYAAGYAITDAGRRSWALRSLSKTGKTTAVVPAFSDEKRLAQVGGLIAAEEAKFSRPAFNLRSNAITFVYQTKVDQTAVSLAGTVTPNETRPQIVDAAVTATKTVTGTGQWRAALHALPALQLETRYCNDGSLVLTPPPGFSDPLGVLETDQDGNVLHWGVARKDDFGIFTFTPDEGVTDLYFYSFEYDTVSGQLYTSNLVHAGAGAATGMTLGTGHLHNGDTVRFNNHAEAIVANADIAVSGMPGEDGDVTRTGTYNDEYTLWDYQVVYLVMRDPEINGTYQHSAYDLDTAIDEHNFKEFSSYNERNADAQKIQAASDAAMKTANENNDALFNGTDLVSMNNLFLTKQTYSAIGFNWLHDSGRSFMQTSGTIQPDYRAPFRATTDSQRFAVNGTRFFVLSLNEYSALPQSVRDQLGKVILRTKVSEEHAIIASDLICATCNHVVSYNNRQIATPTSLTSDVQNVSPAIGFHLLRDHVVYMFQHGKVSTDAVSGTLQEVPAYDPSCTEWDIAVLEPDINLQAIYGTNGDGKRPDISVLGAEYPYQASQKSYLSLLVTDGAGNVKRYGRVLDLKTQSTSVKAFPINIDYASLDYGDRVYVINETYNTSVSWDRPTVAASAPLLVWEQKLDGQINYNRPDYLTGEAVVADMSGITVSGCDQTEIRWANERWYTLSENEEWTADDGSSYVYTTISLSSDPQQIISADIEAAEGVLMAYNGAHEQDDFTGDTLYYGVNGSDNYTWTIVGRQTGGVAAVREKSGTEMLAKDLTTDNVLALMRKDLTAFGDLSVNGYMRYGVLESDLSDALVTVNTKFFKAGSEEKVLTFRPSVMDHQKLADLGLTTALFASNSDAEQSWYLRNTGTASRYGMVDTIQQLQLKKSTPNPTRESVNLNNKDIVFITPADKALTYDALSGCREDSVDEWKLTVCDPRSFYRTGIESASVSGSTVSVSGTWASIDGLENVCVTAWAEKNGEITWLDSVPLESEGDFSETLTIPNGISYDDVYAVVRVDNGKYRTDICSVPMPATPTEVKVEVYVNGRLTDTGCHYTIKKQGTNETKFNTGDLAVVSVDADEGFMIQSAEVFFSDGTSEDFSAFYPSYHGPYREETLAFNVKGIFPTVRIDLSTVEYKILTGVTTYDRNHNLSSVSGGTINVQSGALKDETFNFTVNCKEGYFLFDLRVDGVSVNPSGWINIPTKDGNPIPAYKPGLTYSATMPAHDIRIEAEVWQIPGFILTLIAEPSEGGTLTAELPEGESLDDLLGGSEVKLNPTANEGWKLEKLTYQEGENGEELPFEEDENGYTFIMPYSNVTVKAQYAKAFDVTSELVDVSDLENPKEADGTVRYIVNGKETESFAAGEEVTVEITCAENLAVTAAEATPELELTRTGKYTFTFTMPANDVHLVFNCKKLVVRSAYLHVNQDINLIYTVQVPDGFTNPTATFSFMDRSYETSEYTVGPDGRYHFEFENVTPQYMGEPVDVTVTATYGDRIYSHTNTGYSVQKYCVNMLGTTDDDLLKTLLSDILVYGENAQLYTKYKTDALVTKGVDVSAASTCPGLSGLQEKFIGEADEDFFWNAASLSLSNNVSLVLKFHASDITGLSVKISIDGRTETFTKFTPVEGMEGFYIVSFRGIYATEFDNPIHASFYRDGEQIGNTLQYSVNIYICKKQDDADQVFANLVKALYNYGASSLKYYQERVLKK